MRLLACGSWGVSSTVRHSPALPLFIMQQHLPIVPAVTTLDELTRAVTMFRDDRDWKQFHSLKDSALSLSLEASEVLELFQWKPSDYTPPAEEFGDELADVLYWTLLLAHDARIDLDDAFRGKMAKNAAKYPVEKARSSAAKYTEL